MKLHRKPGILLFLCLACCSTAEEKADRLTQTASLLFNAGKMTDARTVLLKAIAQRDDFVNEWILLGRVELELGHPIEALTAYSRVLELEAANTEALQYVGEISFQIGRNSDALSAADRLLSLNPTATRAMLIKGLVALDEKHFEEAQKTADAILKINPADEYGIVLKGRVLAIGHDYAGAIKLIETTPEALRTEASLSTLIEIYKATGDSKQLFATMAQVMAKRPKDVNFSLDFSQSLYKAGENVRARAILLHLVDTHPDDFGLISKISGLWVENDTAALSPAELALTAQSGSVMKRIGVARYLIAVGRQRDAEDMLRPVMANAEPNGLTADAEALYASLLFAKGDAVAAKAIVDKVLYADTNNKDALLLRAQIAQRRGDLAAALNDVQIVVRDSPQYEPARVALANLYIAKHDPQRARQIYEEAIIDLPQSVVLLDHYSSFLYQSHDIVRAMTIARNFTRKNPNAPKGWAMLDRACTAMRNVSCAQDATAGQRKAMSSVVIDERPGQQRSRGLFGKL